MDTQLMNEQVCAALSIDNSNRDVFRIEIDLSNTEAPKMKVHRYVEEACANDLQCLKLVDGSVSEGVGGAKV